VSQPTKPQQQPKLKNHILPKGKRLRQVLNSKFGVSIAEFDKVINGDIQAAQKIGELARQGRLSSELAPKLAQAYIDIINGSEAYNQATADILLQAGKAAINIDKSTGQVMLANSKYAHQRQELAQQFIFDRNAENTRHQYQLNYQEIKGYVDAHLVGIDNQTALLEQTHRPEIKQIAANEQLHNRQLNEALSKGDNARYDLIPQKNYTGGIKAKLLELKTALGF
jgi:hypothetical protein